MAATVSVSLPARTAAARARRKWVPASGPCGTGVEQMAARAAWKAWTTHPLSGKSWGSLRAASSIRERQRGRRSSLSRPSPWHISAAQSHGSVDAGAWWMAWSMATDHRTQASTQSASGWVAPTPGGRGGRWPPDRPGGRGRPGRCA